MLMNIQEFEKKFNNKGLSFTSQRRQIAEIILNSNDHPDTDTIFFRAKKLDNTISIATVYRTLSLFTELGLLAKREFNDKKSRYETKYEEDHNHIILDTGDIIEFTNPELELIIKKITDTYNLNLEDYKLELYCTKK